jgi:hypothetical protein
MKIKGFYQFINENLNAYSTSKKINLLFSGSWFHPDYLAKRDLALEEAEKIFNTINLDHDSPSDDIVGLFWSKERGPEMINLDKNKIYNHPETIKGLGKLELAKSLQGSKYLPKTVFDYQDIKELSFPIIGKRNDSYQSRGVERFSSPEDLKGVNLNEFDLWQEAKDLKREWRTSWFIGKNEKTPRLLNLYRRTPHNEKAKVNAGVKESADLKEKEKAHFQWTVIDQYTEDPDMPEMAKVMPLVKEILANNPDANIVGIDFAEDQAGNYWVIETNVIPGVRDVQTVLYYLNILKDFYGIQVDRNHEDYPFYRDMASRLKTHTIQFEPGSPIEDSLVLDPEKWYGKVY